jgi:hypothetical protein
MMLLSIPLLIVSAVLWVSCDTGTNGGGGSSAYVLNVDYNTVNNAVFFDFSTGTKTVLPHDFFDIAISASSADNIIANSGSYGSGVQVYKTNSPSTDIGNDFSSDEANVREYTFKATFPTAKLYGYQTTVNPLGSLGDLVGGGPGGPSITPSNVFLVKVQYKDDDTPEYFKVFFDMSMGGGGGPAYKMTVVPGLNSGTADKVDISAGVTGLSAGYGWLYFKLVGDGGPRVLNNGSTWTAGGTAVPPATDWDILGIRTNDLQSEDGSTLSSIMPVAGRSSVLINTYKGVEAGMVTKFIDDVTAADITDATLDGEIDAIGYGWYSMSGMPPTFSVPQQTYIIKTTEDGRVRFMPQSFYGTGNPKPQFHMDFAYYYDEPLAP